MSQGIFITGTDTGVGKTVVAAGLAALFRKRGLSVGVMKPIQTGCPSRRGERIATDARFLLQAAGALSKVNGRISNGASDGMDQVCPYRFKDPVAPLVAAERDDVTIRLDRIAEAYRDLSARHSIMVVEGIGGLLAPITQTVFSIDLALLLKLPVLVVSHTRLGTLNHTLLTIRWAQQMGATVVGVVFNNPVPPTKSLAEKTNPLVFSRLSTVPVLGNIPFMRGMSVEKGRPGRVRNLGQYLNEGLHHLGIKLDP
ncbi:MAG TPA: dethiobiotin synthase [Nitrospiria bacterium]